MMHRFAIPGLSKSPYYYMENLSTSKRMPSTTKKLSSKEDSIDCCLSFARLNTVEVSSSSSWSDRQPHVRDLNVDDEQRRVGQRGT